MGVRSVFGGQSNRTANTTIRVIRKNKERTKECSEENKRKDEIIMAQQDLIKKLTKKLKDLEYQLMYADS